MKFDAELFDTSPELIPSLARRAERLGFDCLWFSEAKHDPFIALALAAANTKKISLGTSIALAFTRSPMALAYTAWDLQKLSDGRLLLGLGTQVKGHIERRFGMKWEPPAPKMQEVVLALHAIWRTWQTGVPLDFRGEFFKIDLMTPFFAPGGIMHPKIPVFIAGVNERMCRLAGSVGDGLHIHPLHTIRYLREIALPAFEQGLKNSGRGRKDIEVATSVFAAVGRTRSQIEGAREAYRRQIAFYASTRTYRKLMELHGWGDACDRLHELSVRGEWDKMREEVTDDMLDEFVVGGTWSGISEELRKRYEGLVDRTRIYRPFDSGDGWKETVMAFQRGRARR